MTCCLFPLAANLFESPVDVDDMLSYSYTRECSCVIMATCVPIVCCHGNIAVTKVSDMTQPDSIQVILTATQWICDMVNSCHKSPHRHLQRMKPLSGCGQREMMVSAAKPTNWLPGLSRLLCITPHAIAVYEDISLSNQTSLFNVQPSTSQ